jgi:hypothetical protein
MVVLMSLRQVERGFIALVKRWLVGKGHRASSLGGVKRLWLMNYSQKFFLVGRVRQLKIISLPEVAWVRLE